MAGDSAVVVKTRKFKKNPLLARKQVRCPIVVGTHIVSLQHELVRINEFEFLTCFLRLAVPATFR
jgi:hypothetical protein